MQALKEENRNRDEVARRNHEMMMKMHEDAQAANAKMHEQIVALANRPP